MKQRITNAANSRKPLVELRNGELVRINGYLYRVSVVGTKPVRLRFIAEQVPGGAR